MSLIVISLILLILLFSRDKAIAQKSHLVVHYNYSLLPIIIILSLISVVEFFYQNSSWYFKPLLGGDYFLVYLWVEGPLFAIIIIWPIYKLIINDIVKYGFIKELRGYTMRIKEKILNGFVELGLGLLVLIIYALIMMGVENLFSIQNMTVPEADFKDILVKTSGSKLLSTLFIFDNIILFPVAEELFFRGYCYNAFKERLGSGKGIVLSALIFSLYHNELLMIIPYFILGIILARGYDRTQSLITPFATHALYNACLSFAVKLV